MDAINGTHLQSKELAYSLKPDSSSMLESHEMVIPNEGDGREGSLNLFADVLNGKRLDRIGGSEHAYGSPRCMDNAGDMVEELTVRNYNDENLAILGTLNSRYVQARQNPWQHVYQIAVRSGSGSSREEAAYREKDPAMSSVREDVAYSGFPKILGQKLPTDNRSEVMEHLKSNENKIVSSNTLPPGAIRTKILSKSGFSEYFVKNTLKGKGIICKGPTRELSGVELGGQTYAKAAGVATVDPDAPLNSSAEIGLTPSDGIAQSWPSLCPDAFHDGVNLREWLKAGQNKGNKIKCLHIFRQIVDLVDLSHSHGVALRDLRPSYFKLLSSNQVICLGSSVQKGIIDNFIDQDSRQLESDRIEKRPLEPDVSPVVTTWEKKRRFGENTNFVRGWPQFPIRSGTKYVYASDTNGNVTGRPDSRNEFNEDHNPKTKSKTQSKSSSPFVSNTSQLLSTSTSDQLEEKWYTSPEELNEGCCTFSSNVYCLGVLLFELLSSFNSGRAHAVAMLDLRHRILPPNFLSGYPKEAGFCLWLLHPEPSSRPTTREILQFEIIRELQELCGDELSTSINQDDTESELLSHFLVSLNEQKQKDASKLVEGIGFLETDIEEVERRQPKKSFVHYCLPKESLKARGNRLHHRESSILEVNSNVSPVSSNESRPMRNISQLESAYFSMRSNVHLSDNDVTTRADKELLRNRENCYQAHKEEEKNKSTDRLGIFFNGLCKYARYNKFEVRGILRNAEFNNSANVICSLSFDRDEDYLAAAGISKKIKIYEFQALFNSSVDIHYPVIELSNKSKLSCICWNSYIRNYMASTDYDGVVKLWDAGTGQDFSQYIEHDKRAWSVDFSQVDPTKLASGSDDCSVKLWSINEKNSLCTIRNIANVCCVRFSAHSSHLLAFGSADYKTYCYDLRNVSTPWCTLAGHDKAVSHVRFLDSETLVSSSTDNSLKLWDLNKTSSSGLSTNACSSTLRGHTNEKNFVGLSVADGFIACGSETNEVFAYYRSLPMPVTSHKFGSIDAISGKETDDDNGQFVSSVCWRRKSDMVVAANSSGCIKLLQMV